MNFQPQPVPQTVAESLPVPLGVNVASRERIGSHSGHSGLHGMRRDMVRIPNDLINLALLGRWRTNDESARHVGTISPVLRAEIEQEQIPLLDYA